MFSWVSGQLPAGVFGGSGQSDFVRLQSVIFYQCMMRFAMFRGTRARAFLRRTRSRCADALKDLSLDGFWDSLARRGAFGVLYGAFGVPVQYQKGEHGFPPERF